MKIYFPHNLKRNFSKTTLSSAAEFYSYDFDSLHLPHYKQAAGRFFNSLFICSEYDRLQRVWIQRTAIQFWFCNGRTQNDVMESRKEINHLVHPAQCRWRCNQLLTFRQRASSILGQTFRYSPENAFYIFNQQIYFIIWYFLDRASLI